MNAFQDHFSQRAERYAQYRPGYPLRVAEVIGQAAPAREMVWEAGCGSGQFSGLLAQVFENVHATDASGAQLGFAVPTPGVSYHEEPAERCSLPDGRADAVVAAQAAHWFDIDGFLQEARRVGRPGGVIALITYAPTEVDAAVDPVVARFQYETLGPHWPPERRHVWTGYSTLPFPFARIPAPDLAIEAEWSGGEFLGYVSSWSGVQALHAAGGDDAWAAFADELEAVWPRDEVRTVRWPLTLLMGRLGE